MKLRYITCSDPREHNSIKSIIDLAHLPHAEIAVQCHPSKMSEGMERNIWFNKFAQEIIQTSRINLAIHINSEWSNEICTKGTIPDIILNWINIYKSNNVPLIKRIQLNMSQNTANNLKPKKLAKIIHDFPKHEFIMQYNPKTKQAIEKLDRTGANFSILFDESGGQGISPASWQKPIKNHPVGYSGGISVNNLIQNLNNIQKLVDNDQDVWIDAEANLKTQTLFEEKPLFDTELAKAYVRRANLWQKQH